MSCTTNRTRGSAPARVAFLTFDGPAIRSANRGDSPKNSYFHNFRAIRARIASNARFAIFSAPIESANPRFAIFSAPKRDSQKGVQFGNPLAQAIRENRARICESWAAASGGVTNGGLRGVWPPFREIGRNRPFSPCFCLFRPFPEAWKI